MRTPSTAPTASRACSAEPSGTSTVVGCEEPAGKCSASTSWPVTDSGVARNCSVSERPLRSPASGSASTASTSSAATVTATGRVVTNDATRAQRPVRVGSSWPTRGTNGQNRRRPKIVIAAGSTSSA